MLAAVTSTFTLAFFYFIGAVPAGTALGLQPGIAAFTAWASYVCGVVLVTVGGAPLRAWLIRRFRLTLEPNPKQLFWRVWERYGLIGLSILAPVTVGSQTGALIGMALGVPPVRLVGMMAFGAALWSGILVVIVSAGAAALQG